MKNAPLLVAVVLGAVACGAEPAGTDPSEQVASQPQEQQGEVLHGNKVHTTRNDAGKLRSTGNLSDHGGRVVSGGAHFYTIFWGSGFESTTSSLYASFLQGLGSSAYWTTNAQYMRGAANAGSYAGTYADGATPPSTVTDADLQAEVHRVLAGGHLKYDPSGVYFVMTPKSVKVCAGSSCSCSSFCGYHSDYTDATYGSVLYSTIPSAAACPTSCGIFTSDADSPNRNVEADEGVSILAHEAEEAQTDALGTAWYDRRGNENADKCAYKYGPTTTLNGAKVNQTWGGTSWLVQMNWSNQISGCAQDGPTDGPYTQ
jgi:hypothetical protein